MASQNPKPQGRQGDTKVKNRGKAVYARPVLNVGKAEQVFEQFQTNGLKYITAKQIFDNDNIRSLRQLRARVGVYMNQRFIIKTLTKCNKKTFMEGLYVKGLMMGYEDLLNDCKSSPEYCWSIKGYFNGS
jgi:hypothetical protein